ncbi:MAG: hypothetical protein WAP23_00505 [Candidatus Spechtbacterales bacterium]
MDAKKLAMIDEQAGDLMGQYCVSRKTGFLAEHPPQSLLLPRKKGESPRNSSFVTLDAFAYRLESTIKHRRIAETIKTLPVPTWPFDDLPRPILHRLMLIYEMGIHAYFREILRYRNVSELMKDSSIKYLPAQLAIPSWELSKLTGIAPSNSYALYALWNYRKKNPRHPLSLDNIEMPLSFTGMIDEKWFVWIHQIIEATVAPGIRALLKAYLLTKNSEPSADEVAVCLYEAARAEMAAVNILERTRERCDYKTYFNSVRLFYSLPRNIVFEGVDELNDEPQEIFGETGGQSASRHFRLLVAGVDHSGDPYFYKMRNHMSRPHRELLEMVADSRVRQFVLAHKNNRPLVRKYNMLIQAIVDWRAEHLSLVGDYITIYGEGHGTGKPPLGWLDDLLEKTKSYLID